MNSDRFIEFAPHTHRLKSHSMNDPRNAPDQRSKTRSYPSERELVKPDADDQ
jgi:hypothetical protein